MPATPLRLDLTGLLNAEARPPVAALSVPAQPRPRRKNRDQQPRPLPVRNARPLRKPGGVR
ncbi:hypothetical protein ABZ249_31275 [Nocardiopsis sp. NPDC006139]|uniref:hypothetical protein n=1 Tax=unclassified Nocardiopsis TaxID=2649073 RepID=UPI0033BF3AB0